MSALCLICHPECFCLYKVALLFDCTCPTILSQSDALLVMLLRLADSWNGGELVRGGWDVTEVASWLSSRFLTRTSLAWLHSHRHNRFWAMLQWGLQPPSLRSCSSSKTVIVDSLRLWTSQLTLNQEAGKVSESLFFCWLYFARFQSKHGCRH